MKVLEKRTKPRKRISESSTDRQERISGWQQERVVRGRALILGAGALGNEVVKNLALMGLGYMFVADMDQVSKSNLSRAVFFRKSDAKRHKYKAEIVAKRAQALNVTPHAVVQTFQGDIVWQLGGGVFRRVDVVLGCLDNVEARMKANAYCLFTGTPFLDGGILGLAGTLTAVQPPATACWECTTSAAERAYASNRYDSCSNLMRRDIEAGRIPTVQVASSIIAGFQTQEAIKVIQGQDWAAGYIIQYDASTGRPDLDVLTISRRPNCWCNNAKTLEGVIELQLSASSNTMNDLVAALIQRGYANPRIALPNPFVMGRSCLRCRRQDPIVRPNFALDTMVLECRFCGAKGNEWIKLLTIEKITIEEFEKLEYSNTMFEGVMKLILADLGFPPLALIPFSNDRSAEMFELVAELTADASNVMGGDQYASVRSNTYLGDIRK
jgi:adenylyltransferase/sulfurtransferase